VEALDNVNVVTADADEGASLMLAVLELPLFVGG